MVRESAIERYLVREIKKISGRAYKFTPHENGMPDRLILLPGGRAVFAEIKRPGEKPRPLQQKRIEDLREMGFRVVVLDSMESVREFIRWDLYDGT